VWLIGAMVCLLAASWVQLSVSAGNGWPHNALRHYWLMTISCHFRDCKALLVTSLTHVSGAIASAQTFTFYIATSRTTNQTTNYFQTCIVSIPSARLFEISVKSVVLNICARKQKGVFLEQNCTVC